MNVKRTDPVLTSIQISLPRHIGQKGAADPMDRPWTTGFFKMSVAGAVRLGATNLDGDGQADLVHHGGPDKAVLAYSAEHYPDWRQSMSNPSPGAAAVVAVHCQPRLVLTISAGNVRFHRMRHRMPTITE